MTSIDKISSLFLNIKCMRFIGDADDKGGGYGIKEISKYIIELIYKSYIA